MTKLQELQKEAVEEFDRTLPCIQLGCDNNGVIAEMVGEDEWDKSQCQYCHENRLPLRGLLFSAIEKAYRQGVEDGEMQTVVKNAIDVEKSFPHNIHLPEYREVETGKLHLHQCPIGNWVKGMCVENAEGDYRNEKRYLTEKSEDLKEVLRELKG